MDDARRALASAAGDGGRPPLLDLLDKLIDRWRDIGFPAIVAGVLIYAQVVSVPQGFAALTQAQKESSTQQAELLRGIATQQQHIAEQLGRIIERK